MTLLHSVCCLRGSPFRRLSRAVLLAACVPFVVPSGQAGDDEILGALDFPARWTVFAPFHREDPVPDAAEWVRIPDLLRAGETELPARHITAIRNQFDFGPIFDVPDTAGQVAYAFVEIESRRDQTATLGMGADWWMQAWINGRKILDTEPEGNMTWPPALTDHQVRVRLQAGTNILAVRFISGSGSSVLALGGPEELREDPPASVVFDVAVEPFEGPPEESWFSGVRHVSVDGSDANDGSRESPWATIQHALDRAAPGATVRLGPGTFHEQVIVRRSGRPDAPVTIEGTLDPDGRRLSRIDAGKTVSPETWHPAPDVGPNVYRNASLDFEPQFLSIDGREVAHVHRVKGLHFRGRWAMGVPEAREDAPWANLAMEVMALPADHEIPRRAGMSIPFWETLGAVYVHDPDPDAGVTYLRMAGGADPREHAVVVSPGGAVITVLQVGHVVIRGVELSSADIGVLVSGEDATQVRIENSGLVHGRSRVHVTQRASQVEILNNRMTIGSYFKTRPGAWGGAGYGEEQARREYLYNFFKQLHGRGTSSDDCSIRLDGEASGIRIEGNELSGGLIGIRFREVQDLLIRNNLIEYHSSVGILISDTAEQVRIDGNRIHDNNINLRAHRLNYGNPRSVYIYRNRLSQPPDVGTHIFCHAMEDRPDYPNPELFFYHNTFVRGNRIFNVPHSGRMPRGVPGFRFFNNVLATRQQAFRAHAVHITNPDAVGAFAFNWVGGQFMGGVPAWFGEGNILAQGEHPWEEEGDDPVFKLPQGHPARGAGLDLSRPFEVDGRSYTPLPDMEPGYFHGDRPDMGAVQYRPGE